MRKRIRFVLLMSSTLLFTNYPVAKKRQRVRDDNPVMEMRFKRDNYLPAHHRLDGL